MQSVDRGGDAVPAAQVRAAYPIRRRARIACEAKGASREAYDVTVVEYRARV